MDRNLWNSLISSLPNPHFLQTYEWGQVKAKYGWQPIHIAWDEKGKMKEGRDANGLSSFFPSIELREGLPPSAACMILKRAIPLGGMSARLAILYAPKGPLLDWTNEALRTRVLNDLQTFAKKEGAIFLKMNRM